MSAAIPIANLYYLFCYAWGHFKEGDELATDATKCPHFIDLLGTVLVNGVRRLRRRGLDRGYVSFEEELREIRGRIDFGASLKRSLLSNGKASCIFDELDHDILHNRIIKATLATLLRAEQLDDGVRRKIQSLDHELSGISLVRIQRSDFSRIQLHRNNVFYSLVLHICRLIYDLMIPMEKTGKAKFSDIRKNEVEMSNLFEVFVRNFYKAERNAHKYEVRREYIYWIVSRATEPDIKYLPRMETDISLESFDRKIIVDTKFYAKTFNTKQDGGAPKINSGDLYQVFSYLSNMKPTLPEDMALEGMLLYPTTTDNVELSYVLGKHRVRVATVDLSDDWRAIHDRLLYLISDNAQKGAEGPQPLRTNALAV